MEREGDNQGDEIFKAIHSITALVVVETFIMIFAEN